MKRRRTAPRTTLCLTTAALLLSDPTAVHVVGEAACCWVSPPPSTSTFFPCGAAEAARDLPTPRRSRARRTGTRKAQTPAGESAAAEAVGIAPAPVPGVAVPRSGDPNDAPERVATSSTSTTTATTTSSTSSTRRRSIHLVSLPARTDSAPPSVRAAWKWKDSALGDGRDYFVPRPRALRALNELLVGTEVEVEVAGEWPQVLPRGQPMDRSDGEEEEEEEENIDYGKAIGSGMAAAAAEEAAPAKFAIEECGVLSNCARLDVVLVVVAAGCGSSHAGKDEEKGTTAASRAVCRAVADTLASQLASYSKRGANAALGGLASFLDLPGVVDPSPPPLTSGDGDCGNVETANELNSALVCLSGPEAVCRHLCRVASGMASSRPSRPGRSVPFRPFSSRDAHVMLQVKRTAEVVIGPRVRALFDASLQAGKAARDPARVPDIEPLREFGTDGRYATEAPETLTDKAVRAATELAVEPALRRCSLRLRAMDASEAVSSFRRYVEDEMRRLGVDVEEEKGGGEVGLTVRRVLHLPCMKLREGRAVDEVEVVRQICDEIGINYGNGKAS